MGSNKIFLLLGLSVAILFVITSEVAARDLAETESYSGEGYNSEGHYGGGGGHYGGGGGHYGGGGGHHGGGGGGCHHGYCHHRCCKYAGEVVEAEATQAKPQN